MLTGCGRLTRLAVLAVALSRLSRGVLHALRAARLPDCQTPQSYNAIHSMTAIPQLRHTATADLPAMPCKGLAVGPDESSIQSH